MSIEEHFLDNLEKEEQEAQREADGFETQTGKRMILQMFYERAVRQLRSVTIEDKKAQRLRKEQNPELERYGNLLARYEKKVKHYKESKEEKN